MKKIFFRATVLKMCALVRKENCKTMNTKTFKTITFLLFIVLGTTLKAQDFSCDDFTEDPWPVGPITYTEGDIVGYTQDGTQPITVGSESSCSFGPSDEGIYVWNFLNFAFDGSNQTARFEIYGWIEQYEFMGFTVNGSAVHYMDASFPIVIDGVTIDLDDSAEDFDDWANAYLIFTGEIDEIDIIGFESGITTLCVEPLFGDDDCDDFTDLTTYPPGYYTIEEEMIGDTIGYTQGETQPITIGATDTDWDGLAINSGEPGFYGGIQLDFAFDGSSQTARFYVYGWIGDGTTIGFTVNGSPIVTYDESFPMVVEGVEVDIDLSAEDVGSFEGFYLTLSGSLETVGLSLFESGVMELCTGPWTGDYPCDNFMDPTAYPEASYSGEGLEGEIIGYTQGGTQTITLGEHSEAWIYTTISEGLGIYTGGSTIDFSFDGSSQSARFHLGESSMGPGTGRSFSVNGSDYTSLHGDYPMIIDGITVDMDSTTAPDLIVGYFDIYLTFSGNLDVVSIRGEDFHESSIVELCIEPFFEDGDCDDFLNTDVWYSPDMFETGLLGYTQGGDYEVNCTEGYGWINSPGDIGINIGEGKVEFEFSGEDQTARFKIYEIGEFSFSANGSTFESLYGDFPLDLGGVTVGFDPSPEDADVDDDYWGDVSYLIFTGALSSVEFEAVEAGILELCVEPLGDDEELECDNFTVDPWPMDEIFEAGEVIGYTQDGTYPVTVGATGSVHVNTDMTYFPGLFINNAPLIFDFDGSDQVVQFEIYEWFGAGSEGFELNGESLVLLDAVYPTTVGGVEVDLEMTGETVGTAEVAYLTFDGEIDEIVIVGGELGITELCYSADTTIIDDSGIETYENKRIKIYPNPADRFVTINSEELIKDIRIYNVSGELVLSQTTIKENQINLNLEEFEQGFYLVELLLVDGTRVIEKLIRE